MREEERQHVLAHEYQHVRRRGLSDKAGLFSGGTASLVQSSVLAFFSFYDGDMERSCVTEC